MEEVRIREITTHEDKGIFIHQIQEAFQQAYEAEFGIYEKKILPIEDIEQSFHEKGSKAYLAQRDGEIVGGALVVIDEKRGYNSLHLLYVRLGMQNSGYGYKIWQAIEKKYPNTRVWETHTPYFDKRNIHFYIK